MNPYVKSVMRGFESPGTRREATKYEPGTLAFASQQHHAQEQVASVASQAVAAPQTAAASQAVAAPQSGSRGAAQVPAVGGAGGSSDEGISLFTILLGGATCAFAGYLVYNAVFPPKEEAPSAGKAGANETDGAAILKHGQVGASSTQPPPAIKETSKAKVTSGAKVRPQPTAGKASRLAIDHFRGRTMNGEYEGLSIEEADRLGEADSDRGVKSKSKSRRVGDPRRTVTKEKGRRVRYEDEEYEEQKHGRYARRPPAYAEDDEEDGDGSNHEGDDDEQDEQNPLPRGFTLI